MLLAGVLAVGEARAALPPNCAQSASTVTCTFSSTGAEQVFSVPAGTTRVRIKAVGAPGGVGAQGETGGAGAVASGTVSSTVGETLYIEVGGAGGQAFAGGGPGFNGGGTGNREAGGGGGASDVRTAPMSAGLTPDTRVLIAGGGGGAGGTGSESALGGAGGAAGAPGGNGGSYSSS
ncbi:MAG TPA: glycine-rich protein, partial [Thermoleophilaceae bacterium]|nr:glycine-rich protein [Thermoleophilaceae bacterium]